MSAGADQRLQITNVKHPESLEVVKSYKRTFGHINHAVSMGATGFEVDENKILTGSSDGKTRLLDLNSPDKIVNSVIENSHPIKYLKVHPSGNFVTMADTTSTVKLWDIRGKNMISAFQEQGKAKTCIENVSQDTFMTSSEDGRLTLWDYRMPDRAVQTSTIIDKEDALQEPTRINQFVTIKGTIYAACDSDLVLCKFHKLFSL